MLKVACTIHKTCYFTIFLHILMLLFHIHKLVLSILESSSLLYKTHEYTHRAAHDWRTGGPVILRATPQWFANVSGLVEQAKVN